MRFSWKALMLSPLAVPFVYSAVFELLAPGNNSIASFLFLFVLGSIFCLALSIFIALPVLFLISRFTPLNATITAAVGTALAGLVYLPIVWQSYLASGDNSGPPQESFASYFLAGIFRGGAVGVSGGRIRDGNAVLVPGKDSRKHPMMP